MHKQMMMPPGTEEAGSGDTEVMNALLRGEVAAAETYGQVLSKFEGQEATTTLQRIRDEHLEAAAVLRERVRQSGGEPSEGSGAWGTFTAAITGTAKVFGPSTALATLKQGEEYGIGQYENALTDEHVDSTGKDLIRYRLLPRCLDHVGHLDRMMTALDKS